LVVQGCFVLFLALADTHASSPVREAVLEVAGDVETPLQLAADDLKTLPRASARVTSDGLPTSGETPRSSK
jgi:hypothetical protein